MDLVAITMKGKSSTLQKRTIYLIVGTCDEAVKAGKLGKYLLSDIETETKGTLRSRTDFVFTVCAMPTLPPCWHVACRSRSLRCS